MPTDSTSSNNKVSSLSKKYTSNQSTAEAQKIKFLEK